MGLGLERPPLWATLVMIVGTIALAIGLPFALTRGHTAPAAPVATETVEPTPEVERPPRVLVIGDGYTAGSDEGGVGAAGWPAVVASELEDDGRQIRVDVDAVDDRGYFARGPEQAPTFAESVQQADEGPYDVAVFFGSSSDSGAGQASTRSGAAAAYATVQERWPDAKLLVIGPAWVGGISPPDVRANRDAVAAAADEVGATFLDPLDEGWFADPTELIGSDGVHPTHEGHRRMASLIAPRLEALLASAPTP